MHVSLCFSLSLFSPSAALYLAFYLTISLYITFSHKRTNTHAPTPTGSLSSQHSCAPLIHEKYSKRNTHTTHNTSTPPQTHLV